MKAADELIASPEFVNLVNSVNTPSRHAASRKFAGSASFSRYMAEIGGPREMSKKEKWVLQALQAKNNVGE